MAHFIDTDTYEIIDNVLVGRARDSPSSPRTDRNCG